MMAIRFCRTHSGDSNWAGVPMSADSSKVGLGCVSSEYHLTSMGRACRFGVGTAGIFSGRPRIQTRGANLPCPQMRRWKSDPGNKYMGGGQNYGLFLGTLHIRCRIIIGIQKGIINFDNHPYAAQEAVLKGIPCWFVEGYHGQPNPKP